MFKIFKTLLKFLFNRSSENTACLMIVISENLDQKDLKDIAEYLLSLREYNEKFVSSPAIVKVGKA